MDSRKVLPLFTAEELKHICKERGIKGFSKLTKAALVDFISVQQSEDELQALVSGPGRKKIGEVMTNATSLLAGKQVGAEKLATIGIHESEIAASFSGFRWETTFSAHVDGLLGPGHQFACDCSAANDGGLCVHFWTAVLYSIATGALVPSNLAGLDPAIISMAIEAAGSVAPGDLEQHAPKQLGDEPLDGILASMTAGQRLRTARRELGLDMPSPSAPGTTTAARKARPAREPKPVERVSIQWNAIDPGPPAFIDARFIKGEGAGQHVSSLLVTIDEKGKVLVHENCPDFEIRMRNSKQLCKHLIEVFLSMDEGLARRLLQDLHLYTWKTFGPVRRGPAEVSRDILATSQEESITDDQALKEELLVWVMDRDGASMDEIIDTFGTTAGTIASVMVGEGILVESGGRYRAR